MRGREIELRSVNLADLARGVLLREGSDQAEIIVEIDDALSVLQFNKKRASVYVAKVIKSAVANYQEQETAPGQNPLVITEARVDGGPIIKRFQPKDRGKAHPIMKRTSHLIVSVSQSEKEA